MYTVASAMPYPGRSTAGSRLKGANRSANRLRVAGCTRSLPLRMVCTPARSNPAMSSADVLRTANSKAKFGPAEYVLPLLASRCSHRAGRCRNPTGLVTTVGTPNRTGKIAPNNRPMSWYNGSHDTEVRSGGRLTFPSSVKKSPMTCFKLAKTFLFETRTPAGVRVDPEVYCKYNVSGRSVSPPRDPGREDLCRASRSSKSSSTIDGVDWPCGGFANGLTLSITADVVRITAGEVSASTESVRSSWGPPYGTDSGTDMSPACIAPRKPTI